MTALLLLAATLAASALVGRRLLRFIRVEPDSLGETSVYSLALGLGVFALVVLVVGLAGYLTQLSVGLVLVLLTAACIKESNSFISAFRDWKKNWRPVEFPLLHAAALTTLFLLALIAIINCFAPPAGHEWDVLSYHLADPKIYIESHRILFLPTDHHSNFPFLMEMLFTVGLLFKGYALANLFHLTTSMLCIAAVYLFGRRFSPFAGPIGAVALAVSPIVFWESSIAYIEMGFSLYVLLAMLTTWHFVEKSDYGYACLAGILIGFALSTKALAVIPFALLFTALLVSRCGLRPILAFLGCALLTGCPFYVKSTIYTGNPVYPFAYSIFGGKYWNEQMARTYAGEQRGFGFSRDWVTVQDDAGNKLPEYAEPSSRLRNLVTDPFALVSLPRLFYNRNDFGFFNHLGYLFLALPLLLPLAGGASKYSRWSACFIAVWFVSWTVSMQYVRYMMPLLPILALIGGEGVVRISRGKLMSTAATLAIALQAFLVFNYFAPRIEANRLYNAAQNAYTDWPGQWELAISSEARTQFLTRSVDAYAATQWLNENTSNSDGIVLFEETRGFYLNRPYIWGNAGHSLFIPYNQFKNGDQMAQWFIDHHYKYALVNLHYAPMLSAPGGAEEFANAVNRSESQLLKMWYKPNYPGEKWRGLLGEALQSGSAVPIPIESARGSAIVEFRDVDGAR